MQLDPPPARLSHRGSVVVACALALVLALAATVVVAAARRAAPDSGASTAPAPWFSGAPTWGRQTALPLAGLARPQSLAVTPAGAVYVVCCEDAGAAQLWIDEPGASAPTHRTLPYPAGGIATDRDGNLYLAAATGITKVTVGDAWDKNAPNETAWNRTAPTETALPFPDPDVPMGIAVDGAGAVYVLHWRAAGPDATIGSTEVWRLDPGARAPVVMPLRGVRLALAIAVDQSGTVYVADGANPRVLRFARGATDPTELVIPGGPPNALAVDRSGALYVATAPTVADGMLFRFPSGSAAAERLPLDGVRWAPGSTVGLGVDRRGSVYVADHDHDRVVKIPREER